jgi:hypothetical protein
MSHLKYPLSVGFPRRFAPRAGAWIEAKEVLNSDLARQ